MTSPFTSGFSVWFCSYDLNLLQQLSVLGQVLVARGELIDAEHIRGDVRIDLSAEAAGHGCELLDAPVTGSEPQAASGELSFFVGGAAGALEKARPVLEPMSRAIVHLGPTGSGALLKLINNFLCGVQVASLAEGLAWIERSGLERDKALEILKSGAPGSPLLSAISTRMTSRDYSVNFLLKLMLKDLQYASAAAADSGVTLKTADCARSLFELAVGEGHGDQDMSSVVETVRHGGPEID